MESNNNNQNNNQNYLEENTFEDQNAGSMEIIEEVQNEWGSSIENSEQQGYSANQDFQFLYKNLTPRHSIAMEQQNIRISFDENLAYGNSNLLSNQLLQHGSKHKRSVVYEDLKMNDPFAHHLQPQRHNSAPQQEGNDQPMNRIVVPNNRIEEEEEVKVNEDIPSAQNNSSGRSQQQEVISEMVSQQESHLQEANSQIVSSKNELEENSQIVNNQSQLPAGRERKNTELLSFFRPMRNLEPQEMFARKNFIQFFSQDRIKIETFDSLKASWHFLYHEEQTRLLSQNTIFINIASALLGLLKRYGIFDHFAKFPLEEIGQRNNPDILAYANYLLRKENEPFSFRKISHPVFHSLHGRNEFAIARLNFVKHQVALILVEIFKKLIAKRTYENKMYFSFDGDDGNEKEINSQIERESGSWKARKLDKSQFEDHRKRGFPQSQISEEKYELLPKSPFNKECAQNFLRAHEISVNENGLDCKINDYLNCIPLKDDAFNYNRENVDSKHYFCPLREFNTPAKNNLNQNFSFLHNMHEYGAIRVVKGFQSLVSKELRNEQTALGMPFLEVLLQDDQILLSDNVKITFASNNFTSKPLSAQVCHYLLDKTLTRQKKLTQSGLYKMDAIPYLKSEFSLSSQLGNEQCLTKELLNSLITPEKAPLGLVEPNILFENLHTLDSWSLNFKWEAYESSPFFISLFLLAQHLKAMTSAQYSFTLKELNAKARNGDMRCDKVLQFYDANYQPVERITSYKVNNNGAINF